MALAFLSPAIIAAVSYDLCFSLSNHSFPASIFSLPHSLALDNLPSAQFLPLTNASLVFSLAVLTAFTSSSLPSRYPLVISAK